MIQPVVVVPDGIAARGRSPCVMAQPSFVFRAVLDHVARTYRGTPIFLAPANDFGCGTSEQEVARGYLQDRGLACLEAPSSPAGGYLDTRANASVLRDFLESEGRWPLPPITLVVSRPHARRAELCFRREGFVIAAVDAVPFVVDSGQRVPRRLWFHRYPFAHWLYEWGALIRDAARPGRASRP